MCANITLFRCLRRLGGQLLAMMYCCLYCLNLRYLSCLLADLSLRLSVPPFVSHCLPALPASLPTYPPPPFIPFLIQSYTPFGGPAQGWGGSDPPSPGGRTPHFLNPAHPPYLLSDLEPCSRPVAGCFQPLPRCPVECQ